MSASLAATPAASADYRFNENLKSSVDPDSVPRLKKVGDGFTFVSGKVRGKTDNFLKWEEGNGLKLATAKEVLGSGGDYTISMLVKLTTTDDYRKLVDFDNLLSDRGLYQYSGNLYPYDVADVPEPSPAPIVAGKWHLLVMTRAGGKVKGYVDGTRYYTLEDPEKYEVLGPDEVLHFFIDDEETETEESAGRVSRIRIWKDPLTGNQAMNLAS